MRYHSFAAICLLLGLFGGTLLAQKGLKVGGFAMPQFVGLYNLDDVDAAPEVYTFDPLWGMAGGLVVGYNFSDYFGIAANAVYSQQGGAYTASEGLNTTTRFVNRLQYFKLPLMLIVNSNPTDRKAMFHIGAGAQVGFLTGAYTYNDNPALGKLLPSNVTQFPGGKELYQPMDLSIVGEIGMDIKLPPDNFLLNLLLRGDYSLQDVENKDASFRISDNGTTESLLYWPNIRGAIRNNDTFGFNIGLLVGVTYIFAD